MKNLNIEYDDLIEAIEHAKSIVLIDNLRNRHPFVQFDSKIRGYLGEICFVKWLKENGVDVEEVNNSSEENCEDVDVFVSNCFKQNIIIEIKTSLIPDIWATMDNVIQNADIKIIKRESSPLENRADFYVQIYFNFLRKERDEFLKSLSGNPLDYSTQELIKIMNLDKLKEFFVAWMDFNNLNANLSEIKYKWWSYGMRKFWKCPLYSSFLPETFIENLKIYKGKNKTEK